MVNIRISPDPKECALRLWNHGWDVEDICDALGVSKASCYRWRRIFDELGTVNKPPSPLKGPTRIITRALITAIENLFVEDSDLFLDEICTWLAFETSNHHQHFSIITQSYTLVAGLTRKILRKFACERDEVYREEFRPSLRNDFIGDGSELWSMKPARGPSLGTTPSHPHLPPRAHSPRPTIAQPVQQPTTISGDVLLPLLIFAVVKSNPPRLVSHLLFTQRYRNSAFAGGEEGHCLINLMAVVVLGV